MAKVVVKIRWQTEVVDTAPVFAPVAGPLERGGPSATHLLALLTMFTALLLAVTLRSSLATFQQDLLRRSMSALHARGIENAEIRFHGLDATITGAQGSSAVSEAARLALLSVPGVRSVRMRILSGFTAPKAPAEAASPTVEVAEALSALRTDLLLFQPGGVALNPASAAHLTRLANALSRHPAAGVEIQGHTDSTGDPNQNMVLSRRRAEAVRDSLLAQGVAPKQLFAAGFGATRPRQDNSTATGRALNRRIELRLRGSD